MVVVWLLPGLISFCLIAFGVIAGTTASALEPDGDAFTRAVVIAVASGFLATAVIELFKRLVPVRGAFHRYAVIRWLGPEAAHQLNVVLVGEAYRGARARSRAIFDLPLEQLAARISSAVVRAADDPLRHQALFLRFAREGIDREIWEARLAEPLDRPTGRRPRKRVGLSEEWASETGIVERDAQDGLDAFQLQAAHDWRRTIAWWSVAVSTAGAVVLCLITDERALLPVVLLAPFVGAFVSWTVRDITALIERARQK